MDKCGSDRPSVIAMQKAFLTKLLFCTCLLLGVLPSCFAQQCTSFGDPVVNITFGAGGNPGPSLRAASTSYGFVTSSCPQDGFYTVTNSTFNCNGNTWQSIPSDHTGNPGGYFMLINASYTPADFYLDTVKGLCENTTYQFAAYIANVLFPNACGGTGIMPNITFSIEPTSGGNPLALIQSGDIAPSYSTNWQQYGLVFTTPPGVTEIVLRMRNTAPGGCGNDLALDDITFRPCGPQVQAGITGAGTTDKASFCVDAQTTLQLDGAISVGYNGPRYQWQESKDSGKTWNDLPGEITTSYTRNPSVLAGSYQYRLVVGEGSNVSLPTCRVSSNVITVQVNPKPIPVLSNNGPKCEGDTIVVTAHDGATYAWTGPNGFTSGDASFTLLPASPAQNGDYHVLVTSQYGCTQTATTNVLAYPLPVPGYSITGSVCEKTPITFTDQSTAGGGQTLASWKWYFGNANSGNTDSATGQTATYQYDQTGAGSLGQIVTTDKGCSNKRTTQLIQVHTTPSADFTLPKICIADPQALFTNNSTISDGTSLNYQWIFGELSSGAANVSTQKDGTHKYAAAGTYSVMLRAESPSGCIKDTVKTFTVNGDHPLAQFTIANSGQLCSNQPVVLTDASSVSPGNIIKVQAYWDYQHDPTNNTLDDDPSAGRQYEHAYPEVSSPPTQDYRIHYVVYSGENCVSQLDRVVTLLASPKTDFDPMNNVCEETSLFQLTGGRETEGFTGVGSYSGRGVSQLGFFNARRAGPGPDTIYYTFTATNGCRATSGMIFEVYPQPHADPGPTQYILQGDIGVLEGSGSGRSISYSWTPADSVLDNPKIPHPRVSPVNDLVYQLTVTSADGCVDSAGVQVIVLQPVIAPNVFSPNGDGINDTWVLRYLDKYPNADVQVFNRYGQPVYHAQGGYSRPWDGTYKGQPLPVGTYYWIIKPGSGRKQMSGSVTILR